MKGRVPWKIVIVAALTMATLSIHYMIFPYPHWVHLIHRRLCYFPILLAALWFGVRGGVIVSALISAATFPLALFYQGSLFGNQDLIEITFYLGLGIVAGVLVDLRERERSRYEELQERLRESERLALVGRMASGVAHEVRTPLGSIQGAAEILAEDYPDDHPRRPFFDILLQEAERLKHVVQDFLDLSRPIAIEPHWLDPAEATRGSCRTLSAVAERKGVEVAVEAEDGCRAYADGRRLHQVLTNLIQNALQFSPRGGAVQVHVGRSGEGCAISVEDGGPGLTEGEEARIFEPFYTRRKDGTGLGLALVKQIVQAHGGAVRGQNRPEGGARFTVWFPPGPLSRGAAPASAAGEGEGR